MKKTLTTASLIALFSAVNVAMADSNSAEVNLSATVTGTANISVAQATPAFPSATITQIMNGTASPVPASNIIVYNDANTTNGYSISVTSGNGFDTNGKPLLKNSADTSSIPLNIALTSCGTSPTTITFPNGYNNASTTVSGSNASSAACTSKQGSISYSLGVPSSSITADSYTDALTFSITQL